jgi:hypothetical protein
MYSAAISFDRAMRRGTAQVFEAALMRPEARLTIVGSD